jgi:folylpolyglutamate synthase/dihydropteroate synthase
VAVSLEGTRFRLCSDRWGTRELASPSPARTRPATQPSPPSCWGSSRTISGPTWDAIETGFAAVRWPGRMQVERLRGTTWLFDVAHNPAGVHVLWPRARRPRPPAPARAREPPSSPDKAWETMLPPLLERADAAVFTVPPSAPAARRWDPERAAASVGAAIPVRAIPDFAAALGRAETLAPHGTIVVTGSVHTVGDALAELGLAGT